MDAEFFALLKEYKYDNRGDLLTLYYEVGAVTCVTALKNARGRKIILEVEEEFRGKEICDPPLTWRYQSRGRRSSGTVLK